MYDLSVINSNARELFPETALYLVGPSGLAIDHRYIFIVNQAGNDLAALDRQSGIVNWSIWSMTNPYKSRIPFESYDLKLEKKNGSILAMVRPTSVSHFCLCRQTFDLNLRLIDRIFVPDERSTCRPLAIEQRRGFKRGDQSFD